jgi:hypothetical protein
MSVWDPNRHSPASVRDHGKAWSITLLHGRCSGFMTRLDKLAASGLSAARLKAPAPQTKASPNIWTTGLLDETPSKENEETKNWNSA